MSGLKAMKLPQDRIDQVFARCRDTKGSKNVATFICTAKTFWRTLSNSLSLVDLSGIWTIAVSSGDDEALDAKLFLDFFCGVARLKYPYLSKYDCCEMLLRDLDIETSLPESLNSSIFEMAVDRSAIHELFKCESELKKAFVMFTNDRCDNLDGGNTWEAVGRLSLTIEVEVFLELSEVYAISPGLLDNERCRALARNILHLYPLPGIGTNPKSSATGLLYPQFELLLIMIAIEAHEISKGTPSSSRTSMSFARKTVGPDTLISRIVSDFLKDIRLGTSAPYVRSVQQSENSHLDEGKSSKPEDADDIDSDSDSSSHNPSASSDCLDQYTSSLQHSRQAMLCRMSEHFETIENYLLADTETCPGPTQTLLNFIANNRREDAQFNSRMRFASKPVVISDAIPLPSALCPQAVEQLLLSALAHHNLGSFKESIMFLDAARTQFIELQKSSGHNDSHDINEVPFELEAYMILSKGNLYRSAGEDEQAMNCYIDGWRFSKEQQQTDWDIIFVNSIGVLAYYSIRYDIALMCFNKVARYREQEYGADSADTATALNNEGCSLFCMHERSEARLRFERCWIVGSKVLGHRAPRAIVMWRNLEKARRSGVAAENKTQRDEMAERVHMRPDSEKLLTGGSFAIKAIAPNKIKKGKKKRAGGKKSKV